MLRKGDIGDMVLWLQKQLNLHGFGPIGVDGVFGKNTENAVKRFQRARKLSVDGIAGPMTQTYLRETPTTPLKLVSLRSPAIIEVLKEKGYTVFDDGQVNLIGVRFESEEANAFDDEMHLVWKSGDAWNHKTYRITTDPGTYWLKNPSNVDGTAILVPGQYPVYQWALHQGRYRTLCQRGGTVTVWRDNNKDNTLDYGGEEHTGWFGINIHHAGTNSTQVDKWSAGCQVFARLTDWGEAMHICESSGVERFTYSLVEEKDLRSTSLA